MGVWKSAFDVEAEQAQLVKEEQIRARIGRSLDVVSQALKGLKSAEILFGEKLRMLKTSRGCMTHLPIKMLVPNYLVHVLPTGLQYSNLYTNLCLR